MKHAVIDIETTGRNPWDSELVACGVGAAEPQEHVDVYKTASMAGAFMDSPEPLAIVCHTSFDLRWLMLAGYTLGPQHAFHDTRMMAWLLSGPGDLDLASLAWEWLGAPEMEKPIRVRKGRVLFEMPEYTPALVPIEDVPWRVMRAYNEKDVLTTARLYVRLREALQDRGLWDFFCGHSAPVSRDVLEMEVAGLPFDSGANEELRESVQGHADKLQRELKDSGGLPDTFNLGSPKQVAAYLFSEGDFEQKDKLRIEDGVPEDFEVEKWGRVWAHGHWTLQGRGLRPAEAGFGSSTHWKEAAKERKQPSTSSISLVLKNEGDEWIADFVHWRELSKLTGTFLAKFPKHAHEGRLYGRLNPCGTATGRLSSSEPNLQQIPAHGSYGANVRDLFRGPMVLGDFSQLEQRVAAHFCQDEVLLKAYREDVDLYGLAASLLFGGDASKDHPQRGLMKTGLLALQYGAGAGKLAQLISIDGGGGMVGWEDASRGQNELNLVTDEQTRRAKELIAQLESVLPRFFAWRREVINEAVKRGYAETLSGRRRYLPFPPEWGTRKQYGLDSDVQRECWMMERQAINAVCQGSAADVVNASIRATKKVFPRSVAWPLLQVHDEVLWERGPAWNADHLQVLRACCEDHGLAVPLKFEAMEVESWAEKGGGATNMTSLFSERMQRNRSEGLQSRKAADLARRRGGESPGLLR